MADLNNEGHFVFTPGACIDKSKDFPSGRYIAKRLLGSGTYGVVIEVVDEKHSRARAAIKLVRRGSTLFREAALKEIRILRELGGHCNTPQLLRDFEHGGHICMVFDLLGEDLLAVLQRGNKTFKLGEIRQISQQLLEALEYVHTKGIIHTDCKTENVLLDPRYGTGEGSIRVKLIDFGSAIYESTQLPLVIGSRQYRSPEALLQIGYSFSTDVWSIGCIIAEAICGRHLFPLCYEDVHLALMAKLTSKPIPQYLLSRSVASLALHSPRPGSHFVANDSSGVARLTPCTEPEMVENFSTIDEMVKDADLADLLKSLLAVDPARRISAREALKHRFFLQQPAFDDVTDLQQNHNSDSIHQTPVAPKNSEEQNKIASEVIPKDMHDAEIARLQNLLDEQVSKTKYSVDVNYLSSEIGKMQAAIDGMVSKAQYEAILIQLAQKDEQIAAMQEILRAKEAELSALNRVSLRRMSASNGSHHIPKDPLWSPVKDMFNKDCVGPEFESFQKKQRDKIPGTKDLFVKMKLAASTNELGRLCQLVRSSSIFPVQQPNFEHQGPQNTQDAFRELISEIENLHNFIGALSACDAQVAAISKRDDHIHVQVDCVFSSETASFLMTSDQAANGHTSSTLISL